MKPRKVLLALTILVSAACGTAPTAPAVDVVKRGEYLVTTMGCNGCHDLSALGRGTEEAFIANLRRPLAAPMPWLNEAAASDQDLRAMFAYLGSVQGGKPTKAVALDQSLPSSQRR
jgi:hypothetical protein